MYRYSHSIKQKNKQSVFPGIPIVRTTEPSGRIESEKLLLKISRVTLWFSAPEKRDSNLHESKQNVDAFHKYETFYTPTLPPLRTSG